MTPYLIALAFIAVNFWSPVAFASEDEFNRAVYGRERFDKYRQVTYWATAELSISDYHSRSGDAEYLELISKDARSWQEEVRQDIRQHFMSEFKKYFGNLPYHDANKDLGERLSKFLRENGTDSDVVNKFDAQEIARRRALYGGHAGAVYCNVRIKRQSFPVLYDIACTISAEEDLRYYRWDEITDIGFSSPEYIHGEIKAAITQMLKERSAWLAKIRKYGRK